MAGGNILLAVAPTAHRCPVDVFPLTVHFAPERHSHDRERTFVVGQGACLRQVAASANGPANGGPTDTPDTSGRTARVSVSWNNGTEIASRHSAGSTAARASVTESAPVRAASMVACRPTSQKPSGVAATRVSPV